MESEIHTMKKKKDIHAKFHEISNEKLAAKELKGTKKRRDDCCIPCQKYCSCGRINCKLLISKLFYFCFWSAYGSFFPLLGVYYKQIGMNPSQSGILVGCRPLIEFVSAPSLSSLADRLSIRKVMILFNLLCWIAFVFPLGMIKPSDNTCHRYMMLAKNISEFTSQETDEVNEFLKSNTPHEPQINPHHKSKVIFSEESVHQVFWVLLFLSIVGEFFASPAPTLADTATLNALGDNKDKYGRQRMFGSLGWGSAMFMVGFVIDALPMYEVCDIKISKNYTYAFYFFLGYMILALVTATRFNFKDADDINETLHGTPKDVVRIFMQPNYFVAVFGAFYAGLGMGLARVFLFWHLEDLGAPPSLFGISSAVDHLSETITYFVIEWILAKLGHVNMLYTGLLVNFVRFICISYLENPWLIIPLDILQGFSHAGVWAALTSYLSKAAPKGYKAAVQGILQGFYYGLGRAVGAIGGGLFAHIFGTNFTFRIYGIGSLPVFILMFLIITIHSSKYCKRPNISDIIKDETKSKFQDKSVITNEVNPNKRVASEKKLSREEMQTERDNGESVSNLDPEKGELRQTDEKLTELPLLTSERTLLSLDTNALNK